MSDPVATMPTSRFWLVKVDCWHMVARRAEPRRVRNSYIVEARDSSEAFIAGREAAELSAPLGPKWIRFESREASTVKLPFQVSR